MEITKIANGLVDVRRNAGVINCEPHRHDCFSIDYCEDGCGVNTVNGVEYEMTSGTAFLLAPTDTHGINSKAPMKYITLMISLGAFPDEILSDILLSGKEIVCNFEGEKMREMQEHLEFLLEEYNKNGRHSLLTVYNLVQIITIEIIRNYYNRNPTGKDSSERKGFDRAIFYLLKNFKNDPSLSDISESLGYNPSYFSKHFGERYGMTYKEYLRSLKLNYAKGLLLSGGLPVAEICRQSGYPSMPVFLSDFKKSFGESPDKFRRRAMNENNGGVSES